MAFLGEAPGATEDALGQPFVGDAGQQLDRLFGSVGISRPFVHLFNVIEHRPPRNDFTIFYKDSKCTKPTDYLLEQWDRVEEYIKTLSANIIVALGDEALKCLMKNPHLSITAWRGSVLQTPSGRKIVATFHPAVLTHGGIIAKFGKDSEGSEDTRIPARPIIMLDLRKAMNEQWTPNIVRAERKVRFVQTPADLTEFMVSLQHAVQSDSPFAVDLEWHRNLITCIGFAFTNTEAWIVPFENSQGRGFWGNVVYGQILDTVRYALGQGKVIGQNFNADRYLLDRTLGIRVPMYWHDTMIAQHVLYPELPKRLSFLTSIHTDVPYYKHWHEAWEKEQDFSTLWTYCGYDCMVDREIGLKQRPLVEQPDYRGTFEQDMALNDAMFRIMLRGVRYDKEKVKVLKKKYTLKVAMLRDAIDTMLPADWQCPMCEGKGTTGKKKVKQCVNCNGKGRGINPKSPKQMHHLVFDVLGCKAKKRTLNENAVRELALKYRYPMLKVMLKYGESYTVLTRYLKTPIDPDGRIRCSYNVAGTVTGRLSSNATPLGTGTNLQNQPKDMRVLFTADLGKVLVAVDEKQAEALVMAYLQEDANLIRAFNTPGMDIHKYTAVLMGLAERVEDVIKDTRDVGKTCRHALNYGASYKVLRREFLKQGKDIPERVCRSYVERYHQANPNLRKLYYPMVQRALREDGFLVTPYGRKRIFMGPWGYDLFKDGYAQLPQSTVVEYLNRGIVRLDQEHPELEMLLQNHDELVWQCAPEDVAKTVKMVSDAIVRPIRYKGYEFTIPLEVKVGPNWKDMKEWKE